MKAYVINLADRTDRWNDVLGQQDLIGIPLVRVNAVDQAQLLNTSDHISVQGVVATWLSHVKAMDQFLQTDEKFALILEDDFLLSQPLQEVYSTKMEKAGIEFLQLGFLTPHFFDLTTLLVHNMEDLVLKIFSRFPNLHLRFQEKNLVRQQKEIPFSWVLNDIRAGGHAYIVSRDFAYAMQRLNQPTCLSTDGFFMALGISNNFRMARLRKNLVKQSLSKSSVQERFRPKGVD